MIRRTLAGSCALLGLAAVTTVAAPAWGAAPSSGCPWNWSRLSVAELTAEGYRVPAQVDSPDQRLSFGHQPGNGNGWVCGVPLGNQSFDGHQVYNFLDDSLQEG